MKSILDEKLKLVEKDSINLNSLILENNGSFDLEDLSMTFMTDSNEELSVFFRISCEGTILDGEFPDSNLNSILVNLESVYIDGVLVELSDKELDFLKYYVEKNI